MALPCFRAGILALPALPELEARPWLCLFWCQTLISHCREGEAQPIQTPTVPCTHPGVQSMSPKSQKAAGPSCSSHGRAGQAHPSGAIPGLIPAFPPPGRFPWRASTFPCFPVLTMQLWGK